MNSHSMKSINSLGLKVESGKLYILDQQLLPQEETWIHCQSPDHMVKIIESLKVRGAPLIGVAAALSLAEFSIGEPDIDKIFEAARYLREARPTAVNLMYAMDKMVLKLNPKEISSEKLVLTAYDIFEEDVELCHSIATNGENLIKDGDNIVTHCNTGGLATAGVGTALGVIRKAFEQGKEIHVYVDETRPLLQGGRLTTWELQKLNIPHTLICDNMAAILMGEKKIQCALVGADRIAVNGDFANKVGTYSLAVNCHHHGIPFYTAAPYTTVDLQCQSGKDIPIEQRQPGEVRGAQGSFGSIQWSPTKCKVYNPAFDVTPVDLLTGMILDKKYITKNEIKDNWLNKGI